MTGRVIAILAAIGALLALGAIGTLSWQLGSAREDLAECRAEKRALVDRLNDQSQAVRDHKVTAERAIADGAVALDIAEAATKARRGQVEALQAAVRAGAAQTCADAVQQVRESLQ